MYSVILRSRSTTCASANLFLQFFSLKLDMLFKSSEMHIEFMKGFKQLAERSACGHHGEGVDMLREARAAIAELAIRARNIGVGFVDVSREEHAGVYLTPVASHLLAILTAGVEVGYLVGTEDVVHVLGVFGFEG